MKRCFRFVLICLALLAGTAFAQGLQRPVPKDVVPGRMTVTLPPEITIDGNKAVTATFITYRIYMPVISQ